MRRRFRIDGDDGHRFHRPPVHLTFDVREQMTVGVSQLLFRNDSVACRPAMRPDVNAQPI